MYGSKEVKKPVVKGPVDGNVFAVMGAVVNALKAAGQQHLVEEYLREAMDGDYNDAVSASLKYVEFDLSTWRADRQAESSAQADGEE